MVSNFLNAATIRPYVAKINVSTLLTQWMDNPKNIELLSAEISKILKDVIQKADDKAVTSFIANKSKELLKEIKLNEVLASGLDIIVERGDQVRILNYIVLKLRGYIMENEAMVRQRVKKESHILIPGFVDNMIASKITNGLAKYLLEIEDDPNHKIRKELNEQLEQFINDIRSSPKWQQELQEVKQMLLDGNRIEQYAAAVWKHLQLSIINDLSQKNLRFSYI
ncbi:DUF445 domain-containing protein [Niabella ginsengisoli]|uniref:DUF445 domain-containing protein n=1 Tax=Niabella ginsengisoli TaxID=522298 RepID=A0ABS9SGE1_9BACT|nr:DUF445 family protein [Niabella ginsengisoli]MCH5597419.1 DUF445 domain-containing protein [Niabella ginsengisoli]